MNAINTQDFMDELTFCIQSEDLIKAKALVQFIPQLPNRIQQRALQEMAKASNHIVFPLIEQISDITPQPPVLKDNLYGLILDKAYGNVNMVNTYITQSGCQCRNLFIKAAGELLLTDTAPTLRQLLKTSQNPAILAAAIEALGEFRLPENNEHLARMARHPDTMVQRKAIFAIAENKEDETVDTLLNFIGQNEYINKLTVEAIADIQSIHALEKLATLLKSHRTIVRDTAIDQLIKLGNKATPILTHAFKNAQADYMLHLITTLGYIKDSAAVTPILKIINTQPPDPNIRQAAYEAMERIPSPKTAICLVQGLQDPIESVRMSAAMALDKNLSRPLVAGLKNILREHSKDSKTAVASLIDSGASNIIKFIADDENFIQMATSHIQETASSETHTQFINKMKAMGKDVVAKALSRKKESIAPDIDVQPAIVVVDDSKMMLKLYRNKLNEMGYSPTVFHEPEKAIGAILKNKPDLLITDLNMPHISGIELSMEIRKNFSPDELPILKITTQSDFVEKKEGDVPVSTQEILDSGINKVLHKPFTTESLQKAVTRFL